LHTGLPRRLGHELKGRAVLLVIWRERILSDLEMEIIRESIHNGANLIRRSNREEKREADVLQDGRILCSHVPAAHKAAIRVKQGSIPWR
jgi:hypothetical protein